MKCWIFHENGPETQETMGFPATVIPLTPGAPYTGHARMTSWGTRLSC